MIIVINISFLNLIAESMRGAEHKVGLSQLLELSNFNDLTLTIYYVDPNNFFFIPVSIENLVSFIHEHLITIHLSLENHPNP